MFLLGQLNRSLNCSILKKIIRNLNETESIFMKIILTKVVGLFSSYCADFYFQIRNVYVYSQTCVSFEHPKTKRKKNVFLLTLTKVLVQGSGISVRDLSDLWSQCWEKIVNVLLLELIYSQGICRARKGGWVRGRNQASLLPLRPRFGKEPDWVIRWFPLVGLNKTGSPKGGSEASRTFGPFPVISFRWYIVQDSSR